MCGMNLLVLLALWLAFGNCGRVVFGEFQFYNLAPTTTSISATGGSLGQVNFASISGGTTANDPTIVNSGLMFTDGQYWDITSIWSQGGKLYTEFGAWVYFIYGIPGRIISFGVTNSMGEKKNIFVDAVSNQIQYRMGTELDTRNTALSGWRFIFADHSGLNSMTTE